MSLQQPLGPCLLALIIAEKKNTDASQHLIESEGTHILDISKEMILLYSDLFNRLAFYQQGKTLKDKADKGKAHWNGVGRHQAPEKKGHEVGSFIFSPWPRVLHLQRGDNKGVFKEPL